MLATCRDSSLLHAIFKSMVPAMPSNSESIGSVGIIKDASCEVLVPHIQVRTDRRYVQQDDRNSLALRME